MVLNGLAADEMKQSVNEDWVRTGGNRSEFPPQSEEDRSKQKLKKGIRK